MGIMEDCMHAGALVFLEFIFPSSAFILLRSFLILSYLSSAVLTLSTKNFQFFYWAYQPCLLDLSSFYTKYLGYFLWSC